MSVYHALLNRWEDSKAVFPNMTYAQLHQAVLQRVYFLEEQGLVAGDRICIQFPKNKEFLYFVLAALAMGCPILPLNDAYTVSEVDFYLEDIEPKLSILLHSPSQSSLNRVDWLVGDLPDLNTGKMATLSSPRELNELALFLYTSGTTGRPKGAMISHANILACLEGLHRAWEWSSKDRLLHVLPLFHVHGLIVAQFGALYANACTVWMEKWDGALAIDLLQKEEISICMMVPTIVYRFLQIDHIPDLPKMRLFTSGSAPLPVSAHRDFQAKFGHAIVERYGMTEVGIVLSNPYQGDRCAGTVGIPVGDTQFRIVNNEGQDVEIGEVGELYISGSSVISGYWRQPEQSALTIDVGWLKSGDLAMLDKNGYYSIVGRSKDLIISGGFNVYPKEVESCILELAEVKEVAVIGLHDPQWGEKVVAVIIGNPTWEQVLTHCRLHLAPYKCPKQMFLVADFPRNAMGKIQKAKLREWYQNS